MNRLLKPMRFARRFARNLLCLLPITRRMVFPQEQLAAQFGRGDAQYAWRVFNHHVKQLQEVQFSGAERVLEIGPGRNLGTALLA